MTWRMTTTQSGISSSRLSRSKMTKYNSYRAIHSLQARSHQPRQNFKNSNKSLASTWQAGRRKRSSCHPSQARRSRVNSHPRRTTAQFLRTRLGNILRKTQILPNRQGRLMRTKIWQKARIFCCHRYCRPLVLVSRQKSKDRKWAQLASFCQASKSPLRSRQCQSLLRSRGGYHSRTAFTRPWAFLAWALLRTHIGEPSWKKVSIWPKVK